MSIICIGGWDPSGLAGLVVDDRAAAALGVHVHGVVTALTAQAGAGSWVVADNLEAQLDAVATWDAAAVKIGMLGGAEVISALRAWLSRRRVFTVLDPVLASSTGVALLSADGLPALRSLLAEVDLVTPNLTEAERLCGLAPGSIADAGGMERAATLLLSQGARAVLVKGGHRAGALAQDLFATASERRWIRASRTDDARGTGCALATSIAAATSWGPARVPTLLDAIVVAKAHVHRGLRDAVHVGHSRRLALTPWPVAAEDFPTVVRHADDPARAFPPLPDVGFYPIVDRADDVLRLAEVGVRTVQLRIKDRGGASLEHELARAIDATRGTPCRLFVNDHLESALALGAFGVHLGQEDLDATPPERIDALADAGILLGVSTHGYAELARARAFGPSYVALGPIWPTTLKAMRFPPQTPARLAEWRQLCGAPLVAIGGVTLPRLAELGPADGVSIVADLKTAPLEERARAYLHAMASRRSVPCAL